jgi:hypothetical protein
MIDQLFDESQSEDEELAEFSAGHLPEADVMSEDSDNVENPQTAQRGKAGNYPNTIDFETEAEFHTWLDKSVWEM